MVLEWKETHDKTLLNDILIESTPMAEAIATSFSTDSNYREDLIQECLLRMINALPNYNPVQGNIHNYFTSVFRNICITYISREYRHDNMLADATYDGSYGSHVINNKSPFPSYILTDLITRNRARFPSLCEIIDELTSHIFSYLISGSEPGAGGGIVKSAMQTFDLPRNIVMSVYHSSLIWLRISNHAIEYHYENMDMEELSLLHELQDLIGIDACSKVCTAFAGVNIKIPRR